MNVHSFIRFPFTVSRKKSVSDEKKIFSIIYLINQYLKNNTVFRMQENAFDFSSQNNMNEYS